MTEQIKMTDSQLHEVVSSLGLDQRERDCVQAGLEIYSRKHGGFREDGVKEMLRHLESAGIISGSKRETLIKKLFASEL